MECTKRVYVGNTVVYRLLSVFWQGLNTFYYKNKVKGKAGKSFFYTVFY